MTRQLDHLLFLLKHSTHKDRQLSQVLAQTITTGLIHVTLTFNSIIRAYTHKSSSPIKAILIYNYFTKSTPVSPDHRTYPSLLQACTLSSSFPKGKQIHAHVIKIGLVDTDMFISNKLIHFYGRLSEIEDARQCFDQMPQRDLVSWNSILATYGVSWDKRVDTLVLFKEMMFSGIEGDEITFVIVLSACTKIGRMGFGRAMHNYIVKVGIERGFEVGNALMFMYTKGGEMDTAFQVFQEMAGQRDIVSHTILINGYVELGLADEARRIFDQLVVKDLVTWNSMINAYVKVKRYKEALQLFGKMEIGVVRPDETTIMSLLSACAGLPDLRLGRSIHRFILQRNIKQDVFVGTALINMYSKCGSFREAMATFYKMDYKDVFTWTAVIKGLADSGNGEEALTLFKQMENEGMKPNEVTFSCVLMACSQSGLVQDGCLLFDRMVKYYKIQPTVEHYSCIVNLLSKAGLLCQAEKFIRNMPYEHRLVAYKILLSACVNYHDMGIGEKIAEELIKLKPQNNEVYIQLSNFYALAGRWNKVTEIREIMRGLDTRKEAGISCIEVQI